MQLRAKPHCWLDVFCQHLSENASPCPKFKPREQSKRLDSLIDPDLYYTDPSLSFGIFFLHCLHSCHPEVHVVLSWLGWCVLVLCTHPSYSCCQLGVFVLNTLDNLLAGSMHLKTWAVPIPSEPECNEDIWRCSRYGPMVSRSICDPEEQTKITIYNI